ncbi:MAG TPA: class I SAM-dependent methyltransferase [Candidatus Saccharimonadales bacterium]|nr:class I SAM-dependent methyltransferase [Candidatus Saccharimonadales bacterium]
MNSPSQQTIQTYNEHVQDYVNHAQRDVPTSVKRLIDKAVAGYSKRSRILEIGSATGRDAAYLQSLGYAVECSDAPPKFVRLLKQNGFNARKINAITDELDSGYDLVFANAVLLHFTREETKIVIGKIYRALIDHGRFAFALQRGEGEEWKKNLSNAPRYFCYWGDEQIQALIKRIGFAKVETTDIEPADRWMHVIAYK